MLVFCNTSKRKLSFTFERPRVLAALPAIPLRDIPATGVRRPCSIPRFARQRHGTHVLLQGRQIAFERPCRHPRTSRRELSGEVFNCHLKPSNRSSDSLNDLLNSSSESIASSSDFIEDSALLKAARVVELVSEGSDGFQLLNVLIKPSRRLPNRLNRRCSLRLSPTSLRSSIFSPISPSSGRVWPFFPRFGGRFPQLAPAFHRPWRSRRPI